MTEPGAVLMGRAELERAFTALGERLARRGVIADLFVVGGAAMALAYDANRVTRDVDATFVPHGVVLDEARAVATELGLPPWWLNEQASVYVSGKDDPGKRRVFDHPNLRIIGHLDEGPSRPRRTLRVASRACATPLLGQVMLTATSTNRPEHAADPHDYWGSRGRGF